MSDEPARRHGSAPERSKRERARLVVVAAVGAVAALFAVFNLDQVEVNWLIGTWETPLIVVIALSIVLGAALGYLVARRRGSAG